MPLAQAEEHRGGGHAAHAFAIGREQLLRSSASARPSSSSRNTRDAATAPRGVGVVAQGVGAIERAVDERERRGISASAVGTRAGAGHV
jgi:hypothetical protein